MEPTQASPAFINAQRIAKAVEKKLVKFTSTVREVKTTEFTFIEIVLRPPHGNHNDEIVTAYSAPYFTIDSEDPEFVKAQLTTKAKRILNDFNILLGFPKA